MGRQLKKKLMVEGEFFGKIPEHLADPATLETNR
jgi:hypothetical protein